MDVKNGILLKKTRIPLSEKAYNFLKEKIISGELRDGEIITEINIATILKMSRTPVKRAITILESESYLKSIDGIGTVVVGLSLKELLDIYEIRLSLEILALKTSINKISPTLISELKRELLKVLEKYKTSYISPSYIANLDSKLHNMIVDNASNQYIRKFMDSIQHQINRYQFDAYSLTDTIYESSIHHLNILEAIENKNLKLAEKLLTKHIKWSCETLKKVLEIY